MLSKPSSVGLEHARRHPGLRGTADMHVGLSEVLLERNELADAAKHLQLSADLGERRRPAPASPTAGG